ncbi:MULTISPECIES: septum formation initiator family protein [Thalassospira]|jgi:cell division protein FtsB|uniref:Septum formation initiator n=1 Tax=Thalassospira povalilytica TaxID=732237 RepID=A0A8I1SK94_9PROT|nr:MULTISPECIES: septum formation initiator family protein [Thalassospira]MEE3044477.1 septum formation initiator family protein [Pseudomonadota bacterium]KZB60704.1 septum formation initiator [Thalassospira sp. MCCC 1A02491]MAL40310.1 septum formation initiator [Thalassospira sp.]MBN8197440.1 septum formation initiator family protein [Thalassospira povalilytica]MBO6770957.1 septum formation initiator family protein [Thalassospira sp.]|tara:strand:- start:760 stop:1113 length:354 start_codon:yes stop_codon:yes gene_type:complete|eukprot:NODE_2771_length_996_cov_1.960875_g2751_i0.p1 GENE.NODE_2771_length_996_cov_1.960875_g2751_i0~~NODE_2771_length_996_cov_1.960875_g2751_i0.p1  ORF type:complete len:118 (+),score=21.59 NODE_2771_length_996_cov_1.960875_g2751_i0:355-708(+)
MSSHSPVFRRLQQAVAPVIAFTVMAYFIFHSVEGERGLLTYWSMQDRVTEIAKVLDETTERRKKLEQHVISLRANHLDPDLLDERARAMLNAAHPDDVIIFHHDGYQDMTTIAAHTN